MMLDLSSLPKNENGFRTTHTCELCGFEPKTKNKYREKQDHLVMKHFKERIDKIFPNCRPYSCPTGNCAFSGKDKQALLRHYTGKHGILERFLREALAEKGINYAPSENGKRRHSESNGKAAGKNPRLSLSPPGLSQMTDMTGEIDIKPVVNNNRPNAEELRREVEAMMRSFQPVEQQPVIVGTFDVTSVNGTTMAIPVTECTTAAVSVSSALPSIVLSAVASATAASVSNSAAASRAATNMLPTQPINVPTITVSSGNHQSHQTISVVVSSRNSCLGPSLSCLPLPIEIITDCDGSVKSSGSSSPVVENDDVMWGAASHSGPAVIVESAHCLPLSYIDGVEAINFAASAATIESIEYDYLYPVTIASGGDVRERQLDFCML